MDPEEEEDDQRVKVEMKDVNMTDMRWQAGSVTMDGVAASAAESEWERVLDETSGRYYLWNVRTNEVRWPQEAPPPPAKPSASSPPPPQSPPPPPPCSRPPDPTAESRIVDPARMAPRERVEPPNPACGELARHGIAHKAQSMLFQDIEARMLMRFSGTTEPGRPTRVNLETVD